MFKDLLKHIKNNESIVIYKHQRPDGDAVFSSFALKAFIDSNFKDKKVEIYSSETYDRFPHLNIVDDEIVKKSLVIVLDTANKQRVDGQNFILGKTIIKIDHHPNDDPYGELNIVDTTACAACEVLTDIFYSKEFKKYTKNEEVCQYLYSGILTDSLNFKTSNTTYRTLLLASNLVKDGNLEVSKLSNYLFNNDIENYKKITKFRNYLKIKKGVGYVIANEKVLNDIGFSGDSAKNNIAEFGSIQGLKAWAVFAYNKNTKKYDASLRSLKLYAVNEIAKEYDGGGHKNAAGIKNLSLKEVREIINKLIILTSDN